VTRTVRRAGAFAAVGVLSLFAPVLGAAAAAPFVAVAGLAAFVVREGWLFEVFARSGDREAGTLYGLAGFALAAAGLALFIPLFDMPPFVFVVSILVLSGGNLAEVVATHYDRRPVFATTAFVIGGALFGLAGHLVVALADPASVPPLAVLYAASAGLLAALVRTVFSRRDDPLVLFSAGLFVWVLYALPLSNSPSGIAAAVAVSAGFGVLAYVLDVATVSGMVTGVLAGLVIIVLGGFGWFALLIAFFGIGGLSSRFGYERKLERGVAEDNDGARGSANVLANAAVALAAVVGFAASPLFPVENTVFVFVFAGSLAAAMADTLSSEVGGVFDSPRLITTLEPVPPGTDGGVTWQGVLAGVAGSVLVAGLAGLALPVSLIGVVVIATTGVIGTVVDSLLGALVENYRFETVMGGFARGLGDRQINNTAVNFLATLAAGAACGGLAVTVGLAPL